MNPRGQTTVFANHVNPGSESTENRALTPSKPPMFVIPPLARE